MSEFTVLNNVWAKFDSRRLFSQLIKVSIFSALAENLMLRGGATSTISDITHSFEANPDPTIGIHKRDVETWGYTQRRGKLSQICLYTRNFTGRSRRCNFKDFNVTIFSPRRFSCFPKSAVSNCGEGWSSWMGLSTFNTCGNVDL